MGRIVVMVRDLRAACDGGIHRRHELAEPLGRRWQVACCQVVELVWLVVDHQGGREDVRGALRAVHGEDDVKLSVPEAPHATASHGGNVGAYSWNYVQEALPVSTGDVHRGAGIQQQEQRRLAVFGG